jgi:hypothetical protein
MSTLVEQTVKRAQACVGLARLLRDFSQRL